MDATVEPGYSDIRDSAILGLIWGVIWEYFDGDPEILAKTPYKVACPL